MRLNADQQQQVQLDPRRIAVDPSSRRRHEWDGMARWFLDQVHQQPALLKKGQQHPT
ncbi:hypothetical protein CBM2633_P10018 [Cupriavidus taiwanensis]|uniref:Uncharacterized protein n=2 Tax=Cupriavidus TaxID=106589 RepID=A0A375DA14_9BURK|nr:hypothetical protein CBM2592_P10018 [Cupriavidus taiwanensis]SOZ40366.1 hypothetical protein CBM2605_P10019 [Cupriavidus neocaledonicus]SOY73995.1 hypothetical protein CBM2588_P10018 [Cupriavidus taiwanensis]SOY74273.1 hypothetical protein CBM2585_P10018 [Cupriavidus taiwanensis]SOY75222.1 hypothetical protein CBM2589_P10018 [Cupriavidus taiwanensis]